MAKVRLIKIASEINIGRDAIVSFLQNKGFDIENKPTAFLTPEMAELVYDKFKKELKLAEKQREKVEKMKEARKTAAAGSRAKTTAKTVEKETAQVEEEPVKKVVPAKTRKKTAKKTAVSSLIEEITQDGEKKKTGKTKKVAEDLIEEVKPEAKTTEKEEKNKKTKEVKKEAAEEKTKKERKSRKRKKRKTIAEVKLDEKGAVDKKATKGLKIVGKINLEEKKKPKESATTHTEEPQPVHGKEKFRKKDKGTKKKFEIGADKVEKRKKKRKKSRIEIKDEDVQRAMRETLAGMEDSVLSGKKSKLKQKKKIQREEKEKKKLEEQRIEAKTLKLTEFVTTADLAEMIGVGANDIILKCFELGLVVSINQRLDKDTITLIADDYGLDVEFIDEQTMQILELEQEDPPESLKPRPPIVTIMGHVDHGKTSLLDFIRKSNIVAGEKGSITQHIGAYRVVVDDDKSITFLDTPGHQAFTAMRARGAMVTDIVVLVVAADDSVMPQTIEAISHAQAANVPIIVAINKIDKDDANPERIKQQLADLNVLVEEWGGKTQSVEISAKKGINIDLLLEKILLEAEILDLKANPDRNAMGTIVEAKMEKGFGAVATVIVQQGTLRIGDSFVAGTHWGKVRRLLDERSNDLTDAGPSTPVKVIGFNGLPEAGDLFAGVESEAKAKQIATDRNILKRQQEVKRAKHITLDMLSQQIHEGEINKLNLIIKADVAGSVEALSDSLQKLSTDEVQVNIIHKSVGNINESDVMLAMASGAVIIGFHVKPLGVARKLAENNKIDIRLYDIIYDCIEEVRLSLEGLLTPDTKEEVTAEVEVRKVYKISKIGTVAGCYVLTGKVTRNDKARLLRDGLPVYDGMLASLKRNKDDVKEVDSGYECGIMLNNFNDIKVGDIIQTYKLVEVQKKL
jgi:translation initiation factor IF-2